MHLAFHIHVTPTSLEWVHGSRFGILGECDLYTLVNKVAERSISLALFHTSLQESVVSHKLSPLDTQNENAELLKNTCRTGNHI